MTMPLHSWERDHADWDAEEDECGEGGEGEDDYGEYGDGRWGSDGNRHCEDDDMWAADAW